MKAEFVERNYHASDRLKEVLQKKLKKLDKYFGDDVVARVVLSQNGKRCRLEISIPYYGLLLRSEVEGNTMYHNIDDALPNIERQIIKHSEKFNDRKNLPEFGDEYAFVAGVELDRQEITKTKEFEIFAISTDDAIANLDLSDHDFYVYINEDTDRMEIVYRRNDGSIGLLKPYTTA